MVEASWNDKIVHVFSQQYASFECLCVCVYSPFVCVFCMVLRN